MRIVIDGRLWFESGLGRYVRNLVNELQQIDNQNEYFILLLKKDYSLVPFDNENFHKVLADFKWYGISEQIKLPELLSNLNPDLVHFPHFNVPIFYRGKFLVTIHDLIHQHFQTRETSTHNFIMHAVKKIGYKTIFSHAVEKSDKIFVPSEFIKDQLVQEWGIDKDKIIVTLEGVDERIIRGVDNKNLDDPPQKINFQKPYLFYVGNAQPHKNIHRLINVFGKLKEKYPDLSLVLSGPNHYFWEKTQKEISIKGIIFTGFISDEEMVTLYKNASAFIMPSLEEGFGIPILEAMACGCPVVSSNAGSLKEVGGNAAVYFNPKDNKDMEDKISQVLDNEKLRMDLVQKGEKRYQKFSWKNMAKQTLEIYNQSYS